MSMTEVGALPQRPDSEVEWEDLLLRLEIVPRVARNEVDEVRDLASAAALLGEAIDREQRVARWLEQAAGLASSDQGTAQAEAGESWDPVALVHRFASLRARTFAMVQRRGLEVWEWRAPLEDGGGAPSAHQLLLWLAHRDGELLAALRQAAGRPR